MRVMLDANIWIEQHLLRSSLGAALIFALKNVGGNLLLPRVTQQEAENGIVKIGESALDQIGKSFRTIQAIVGHVPEYTFPSREELSRKARERLEGLSSFITTIETSTAMYEAAMNRVLDHRPPNSRNEQFRDSMLWEALLCQAVGSPIHLVTLDKAFYEGSSFEGGLAKALRHEAKECGLEVHAHRNLESLLPTLDRGALRADVEAICVALRPPLEKELVNLAQLRGFEVGEYRSGSLDAFLTERHHILAVTFQFTYGASNVPGPNGLLEEPTTLYVDGDASFDLDTKSAFDIRLGRATVLRASGEMVPGVSTAFMSFSGVLGTRQLPYSLRKKLSQ